MPRLTLLSVSTLLTLMPLSTLRAAPTITLDPTAFRDRVYACFLGKNIGGTLGMPVEGARETHQFTFFTPVPTEPAANDDLDLQLLWLKALEERGPGITCRDLGDFWLQFVPVDWNEYGVGKQNMRDGFPPPLSGQIRNERWRDSNGAWIRSEIWACVAPGYPDLAARYAFEDACVDHGVGEGTWAEMFTAALESAAFVESDRDKLIAIGLSYIPQDCAVRRSVLAAIKAWEDKLDLMAAREAVVQASASTGWFMAPQNVAFVILGWLYGEGDFGKSLCAAVNCGDDTDCTGATLGSLLGILRGTAGIPQEWRKPVGDEIRNVAIGGFVPARTLGELTERVVALAPQVLAHDGIAVFVQGAGEAVKTQDINLQGPGRAGELWSRSPYRVDWRFYGLQATLDYGSEPTIGGGESRPLRLSLQSAAPLPPKARVVWETPPGLAAVPTESRLALPGDEGAEATCETVLTARQLPEGVVHGRIRVLDGGRELARIPFAFLGKLVVHANDLALSAKGATATSDSELERERGCTPEVIDGFIATPDTFEDRRWHSALTPHPHWIAVDLGREATVSRVIVHFADPAGHPVDFEGESSLDGQTWTRLFEERGYGDSRRCDKKLDGVKLRHFRLTIWKSSSERWPGAAQVGEIEVLGE